MSAATNSAAGGLSTPTLDAESSNILRSVSSHGGYAFVGMATLAAATGDIKAAEAARDMAWEQLHSGPWHSVLPVWRDAYSMACLHVAKSLYGKGGDYKDALRALDMGLIMGGPLLRDDLHAAVDVIVSSANNSESSETGDGGGGGRSSSSISSSSGSSVFQFQDSEFPPQPHHRSDDHAEVLRVLPIKSLSCKLVVKRSALSLEAFLREHLLPASPVIITDSMAHWPATTRWHDMDYLKRVAGDRTVPVEVGKNYLCQDWKQELISFSCFLERIQSIEFSSAVPTYLAQHPLFDQINELRKDICIPDYCFAGGGELRSLNAWFGPAGTVTPLHHDPHHNILAQVVGKKYFRLYPASLSEELYPYSEIMLCNSSQVDLDNIDEREFPKVHDLEFMDCILEEGEMLYIPPRWWHYVRSLSTSFSVSFWWSDTGISNAF